MSSNSRIELEASSEAIIACVAEEFGVEVHRILSRSRARDVNEARATAIWLCLHQQSHPSIVTVGEWFDRDHTTIMYHRDVVAERMNTEHPYAARVRKLIWRLSPRPGRPRFRRRHPSHLLLVAMRDHIVLAEQHTDAEEIGYCGNDAIVALGDGSLWIGGYLLSSPLLRVALTASRSRRPVYLPRPLAVAAD